MLYLKKLKNKFKNRKKKKIRAEIDKIDTKSTKD